MALNLKKEEGRLLLAAGESCRKSAEGEGGRRRGVGRTAAGQEKGEKIKEKGKWADGPSNEKEERKKRRKKERKGRMGK